MVFGSANGTFSMVGAMIGRGNELGCEIGSAIHVDEGIGIFVVKAYKGNREGEFFKEC
jgi:hypothetical protein